tara:strand:+ start:1292 stop:1738 length:447 start_codon:yes stop_codon:yes gene_type:complete
VKKLLSILFVLTSIISSCRNEGCTNPDATNYDAAASKDNGSCLLLGEVMFWSICDSCVDSVELFPYVAVEIGARVEGYMRDVSYASEPDAQNCEARGCVTGTLPTGIHEWTAYEVYGDYELTDTIGSGDVVINANGCTKVSIPYRRFN